ncbi:MAG: amidohydrolase [Anaerolineae bacterium]
MSSDLKPELRLDQLVDISTVVSDRRDFHKHAETGWTEFRTASLIARRLTDLGLVVAVGEDVIAADARMGVPAPNILAAHWDRARRQGGDPEFLEAVKDGFTGVVARLGDGSGPTIGLRFDIDAVDVEESHAETHRPVREEFASVNPGAAHACGHDGHAAIGLAVARALVELRDELTGTVKLIFQPAEEGVRGAKSMVAAGVVDDVDLLLGLHLYSGWKLGQVAAGKSGYMATTKFDAQITGKPAHAGGAPQNGKNAMLAAATAVLNLHAIPRHRAGPTRINVGRLVSGQGRNVISPSAHLVLETRGATRELNQYMYAAAMRVLKAAAAMYDCELKVRGMGSAQSADSDPILAGRVSEVAAQIDDLSIRLPEAGGGGSEDYTYMMRRVQEHGGLATAIGFGANLGDWGHHTAEFDFDERALPLAASLLVRTVFHLQANPPAAPS